MNPTQILSTKTLSILQRNIVSECNIAIEEHNFISVQSISVDIPQVVENAIFSSQNAVKALKNTVVKHAFCIGRKTASNLENITVVNDSSQELAQTIVNNYSDKHFSFFCGNLRREELPSTLRKNDISFEEIQVYKTVFTPKILKKAYDGILFFSPSAISSFCEKNDIGKAVAFCIGNSTAQKAKQFTNSIEISRFTSIEGVLECIKNYYHEAKK